MILRVPVLALALTVLPAAPQATHTPTLQSATSSDAPARTRLILKDGTFQSVLSYTVQGSIVRYRSAERNGEQEEIPLALVDLPATQQWAKEHLPGAPANQKPVLSPELAKEEADRAARTPEVATGLRLPEEDAVLVLDTFHGTKELVPLAQAASDLNRETGHAVLKVAINPQSSAHRIADIPGITADVQLHTSEPVFYVRVGTDKEEEQTSGSAMTVDTHGVVGRETPGVSSIDSSYVLERIDVRIDQRQLDSFRIGELGNGRGQRDITELKHEDLPGGHWLKLTTVEPLLPGEYALVEIVSDHEVNISVWDFGVHPDAKENAEAQKPEQRKAPSLQPR